MTPARKKDFLEDILRIDVFKDCCKTVKDKMKNVAGQMKYIEAQIASTDFDNIKNDIEHLTEKKYIYQRIISHKQKLLDDYDIDRVILPLERYAELQTLGPLNSHDKIDLAMQDLVNKIDNANTNTENIDMVKNNLHTYETRLQTLDNEYQHNNYLSKQKKLYDSVEKLTKNISPLPEGWKSYDHILAAKKADKMKCEERRLRTMLDDNVVPDICEDEVNVLKGKISKYRNCITSDTKATIDAVLNDKCVQQETKIRDYIDKTLDSGKIIPRDIEDYNLLREHGDNVEKLLTDICKVSTHPTVIESANKWITTYRTWSEFMSDMVNVYGYFDLEKETRILYKIQEQSINNIDAVINVRLNKYYWDKVHDAEARLEEINNLIRLRYDNNIRKKELSLVTEKIKMIDNEISKYVAYREAHNKNKELAKKIKPIHEKINIVNDITRKYQHARTEIIQEISSLKDKINMCVIESDNLLLWKKQIYLLEKYTYKFTEWKIKTIMDDQWRLVVNKVRDEIDKSKGKLTICDINLKTATKNLHDYMKIRADHDILQNKYNTYQLYTNIMNKDGIPYQILKTFIPVIECEVNNILQSMVGLTVIFECGDGKKTNIDINICNDEMKPRKMAMAAGLESFSIGLAVRMALGKISMKSKPNFIVIDEGWSCIDSTKRNNLVDIMDYLRQQYEHIIIISHLDELKTHMDYVIPIYKKKNGKSYIGTL
jgi:DNA repair exonuclease SbcCD ATPase subunit